MKLSNLLSVVLFALATLVMACKDKSSPLGEPHHPDTPGGNNNPVASTTPSGHASAGVGNGGMLGSGSGKPGLTTSEAKADFWDKLFWGGHKTGKAVRGALGWLIIRVIIFFASLTAVGWLMWKLPGWTKLVPLIAWVVIFLYWLGT